MLYKIGRALQVIGMLVLPIAIAGQATSSMTLGQMLLWTAVGIGIFGAGWLLQEMAGKK